MTEQGTPATNNPAKNWLKNNHERVGQSVSPCGGKARTRESSQADEGKKGRGEV